MKDFNSTLNSYLKLAIAKHVYQGDRLYLAALENYKGDRLYMVLAESQSLLHIPTGAGGTRWNQFIPVTQWAKSLNEGKSGSIQSCHIEGDRCLWKVLKLDLLDLDCSEIAA